LDVGGSRIRLVAKNCNDAVFGRETWPRGLKAAWLSNYMYGLKAVPFRNRSFSAASLALPYRSRHSPGLAAEVRFLFDLRSTSWAKRSAERPG
jgi:hypothetical protein